MRRLILICLPFLASLGAAAGARAVVVDMKALGSGNSVAFNSSDQSGYYGVALVPSAREGTSTTNGVLAGSGIPVVTSSGVCSDPAAVTEPDILSASAGWPLSNPLAPLCFHSGGTVMHSNETFAVEWESQADPYWESAKSYVQTFLSDVAAASGSLSNPYADTTQYWDGSSVQDRAQYKSVFGGACMDNGSTCQFSSATGSGPGKALPSSGCTVSGQDVYGAQGAGSFITGPNDLCLTDAQIQSEVTNVYDNDGLKAHTLPGYTPLVVVLTPPGVVVCLDANNKLCSVNGQFVPQPPTLTAAATGGTVPAGTYKVVITYVTGTGQTVASASQSVATTGSTSTITIASPPAPSGLSGVTGWDAYVTQPGGSTYTLQGATNPIGTDHTLNAPPTSSGSQPPAPPATFCSYHGQVTDPSGSAVSYVVQPWTAFTSCDEPDVSPVPANPPPSTLETLAGQRLVSPLSQSEMAAIVNPGLNGWYGQSGLEIDDQNACQPLPNGLDTFTINGSSYLLQREFNNTSVVDRDPNTYAGCLPNDILTPAFVTPSAINLGDTLDLDGSSTGTSLDIPSANYVWDFGDGTTGTGPSVEHTFTTGGTYTVKLTVTDRGGNIETLSQAVQVLSATGQPVVTTTVPPAEGSGSGGGSQGKAPAFKFSLQLLPQGFRSVLRRGIAVRVHSNRDADGFATIAISRRLAKRVGIKTGRGSIVVIGTGTVSGVMDGAVTLRLHMSRAMAKKLGRLRHVTLSVRLALVAKGGAHFAADVAGHY